MNFALANKRYERIIESDPVLMRRIIRFQNASFINSMSLQKRNMDLEYTIRQQTNSKLQDYLRW